MSEIEMSPAINELAAALAKAQAVIQHAREDANNPHFKSRYATLASVWDACREPLTKNGLSIIQTPLSDGPRVTVATTLLHSSGQWLMGRISATARDATPQAIGSCITYLRRYSLASTAGVAPGDDDDGNAAAPPSNNPQRSPVQSFTPEDDDLPFGPSSQERRPQAPQTYNDTPDDQAKLAERLKTRIARDPSLGDEAVRVKIRANLKGKPWTQLDTAIMRSKP